MSAHRTIVGGHRDEAYLIVLRHYFGRRARITRLGGRLARRHPAYSKFREQRARTRQSAPGKWDDTGRTGRPSHGGHEQQPVGGSLFEHSKWLGSPTPAQQMDL